MRLARSFVRFAAAALCAAGLAACETTGPGPFAMASAPSTAPAPAPMTRTRAASECWMATEKTAQRMTLDKRADIVGACIDKKMRG